MRKKGSVDREDTCPVELQAMVEVEKRLTDMKVVKIPLCFARVNSFEAFLAKISTKKHKHFLYSIEF